MARGQNLELLKKLYDLYSSFQPYLEIIYTWTIGISIL